MRRTLAAVLACAVLAADASDLESFVREHYTAKVEPGEGVDQEDKAANRFANVGEVEEINFISALKMDGVACDGYIALADGPYCWRMIEDQLRIEPIDQSQLYGLAEARALVEEGLGERYAEIRDFAIIKSLLRSDRLTCASYLMNQVEFTPADVEQIFRAPRSYVDGFVCRIGDRLVDSGFAVARNVPLVEIRVFQVWDVLDFRGTETVLAHWQGCDGRCAGFSGFHMHDGRLREMSTLPFWEF